MTVFVSSGAFRVHTVAEAIDEALRLDVTNVELSSGLAHDPDLNEDIKRGCDSGLTFLLHNYFPAPETPRVLNLCAATDDDLQWSIDHCKHALDIATTIGCPFYSLHAGYAVPLTAEMLGNPSVQASAMKDQPVDREASYQRMKEAVQDVADYALALGKRLLIENNVISPVYLRDVPENPLLMTDGEEIERFMCEVDRSNVGFLIDVGHARVSASALEFDPIEFMARVKPFTEALHLSDNDTQEDQNLTFDETAWFWPLLKDFADHPKVIEAYTLPDSDLTAVRARLGDLSR